jgi:predicted permease
MWVLPRGFRSAFGQDVVESFRDLCRREHERGGVRAVVALWRRSTVQLVLCGARERLAGIQERLFRPAGKPPRRRQPGARDAIEGVVQGIRLAVRSYVRNPGFALTAVAIIGLGIGATTTIFSVVDTVLLKQLPYPQPRQLVYFDHASHPAPLYRDWRDRTEAFDAMAAAWDRDIDLTGDGEPERLDGAIVTRAFFDLFGAEPFLGRLFVNDDFTGEPRVTVLSHGLWQRRFGGDPSVIGRTVVLDRSPLVVVGILDPAFSPPPNVVRSGTDVWVPLDIMTPAIQHRGLFILNVAARLAPAVTVDAAQAELNVLGENLAEEYPDRYRRGDGTPRPMDIVPLRDAMVGEVGGTLFMLLGAVGLMLVIACANVANLFLARGTDREREMALRAALGAGRTRLMTQLLTESLVTALTGGALGVAIAYAGVRAFTLLNPGNIPFVDQIAVDPRVLSFAFMVSATTGIVFGLFPAWQAARADVNDALKDASAGAVGGRKRARTRSALVVAEIALALVLLVGAGLLFNSFVRRLQVDPGFDPERLMMVPLVLQSGTYDEARRAQFARNVMERVKGIPGVREASHGVTVPLMYYGRTRCCWRERGFRSDDLGEENEELAVLVHPVSTNYFNTLGANVRGRELQPEDDHMTPAPAVLAETLADQMFPDVDALGRSFTLDDMEFVTVGVVPGLRHWGLDQEVEVEMFVPYDTFGVGFRRFNLVVRTAADPATVAQALRQAIWAVEPDLPVDEVITMRLRIATSMTGPRFYSALLLSFAAVALMLAAGGIYGSMLYSVGQRHRELGIRIALGARGNDVVKMVVGQAAVLALVGIGLGMVGALAVARSLESFVFGITTTDIPTFAAVAALLAVVAVAASYIPARRAARADPMEALRSE